MQIRFTAFPLSRANSRLDAPVDPKTQKISQVLNTLPKQETPKLSSPVELCTRISRRYFWTGAGAARTRSSPDGSRGRLETRRVTVAAGRVERDRGTVRSGEEVTVAILGITVAAGRVERARGTVGSGERVTVAAEVEGRQVQRGRGPRRRGRRESMDLEGSDIHRAPWISSADCFTCCKDKNKKNL